MEHLLETPHPTRSRFLGRPHVVAEMAQLFDKRQREILIDIHPGHESLLCLVLADIFVDRDLRCSDYSTAGSHLALLPVELARAGCNAFLR